MNKDNEWRYVGFFNLKLKGPYGNLVREIVFVFTISYCWFTWNLFTEVPRQFDNKFNEQLVPNNKSLVLTKLTGREWGR